ncbi:MAG: hypothetical protein Q8S52_17745 [Methylobacter sp.]|nr:hypothetical protein [Methylobacter sp.]MDP2426698.1 hypothetical protein [Methylobacter sp.]MDP3055365.1 hypothetical protein [Methylobacter sp.]MDP3363955.1 hypothetical protein [Methylobacter sp.]
MANERKRNKIKSGQNKQSEALCIECANNCLSEAFGELWDSKLMSIQKGLVGVTTLKNRGWNHTMIAAMGDPDKLVTNPHYRSGPLRALYAVWRIKDFESQNIDRLKANIESRIGRRAKLAENPPKPRKPTGKQMQKMSHELCALFSKTMPKKLLNDLCVQICEAAKTSEPWSAVNKVLAGFRSKYHENRRPINLDHVELRELKLGKSGLCSFVFYISHENGISGSIMEFVEFSTPEPANPIMLDVINHSAAVARAARLLS